MPKIVDKEQKRREIALKAMDLFAQKGFEKSSIREIAEIAGMGKGTFYDYFNDKFDLLNEIARFVFSTWNDHFAKEINKTEVPLEQIKIIIEEGTASAQTFEQFMILYIEIWRLSVGKSPYDQFHKTFQKFLKDSKAMLASIIDRGKEEGTIRGDVNSGAVATSIIAFVDGICLHYLVLKPKFNIKEAASEFLKTLFEGIKT